MAIKKIKKNKNITLSKIRLEVKTEIKTIKTFFSFLARNINNILIKKLYSIYIFKSFAKIFFVWSIVFFLILLSNNIDLDQDLSKKFKIITIFSKSFESFISIFNIVALVCCIIYFIHSKKSFDFLLLKCFGIQSERILKPIIIFLLLISSVKTMILQPLSSMLGNIRKTQTRYSWQKSILKNNTKFTITDGKNNKNYTIISGSYNKHSDSRIDITDATFQQYEKHELTTVYSAKQAYLLNNGIWNLIKINKTDIKQKKNTNLEKQTIRSFLSIQEMIIEIQNTIKMKKLLLIGLYDYIKLTSNKHESSLESDAFAKARIYLSNEIISLFCNILSCLIAYFFCVTHVRSANIIKSSIECFIIYFIILRIIRAMENIIAISFFSALCVCSLILILCIVVYILIIEKDCKYLNLIRLKEVIQTKIKKIIKNVKIEKFTTLT